MEMFDESGHMVVLKLDSEVINFAVQLVLNNEFSELCHGLLKPVLREFFKRLG